MPSPSSGKPTVLFVDHALSILGGAEINLIELLAHEGCAQRWNVQVACYPTSPLDKRLSEKRICRIPYRVAGEFNQIRVVGKRLSPVRVWRGQRALRNARRDFKKIVESCRPEAVISCTGKDHLVAGPVLTGLKRPSVWWINDILSSDFFPWPVRKAFAWTARRHATQLIAVSDYVRTALVDQGVPADRIIRIHNGIPMNAYTVPTATASQVRFQLGLPQERTLVGMVGRFTPWKGVHFFIELAGRLQHVTTPSPLHFVIVGQAFNEDQDYLAEIRDQIARKGLESQVTILPFQDSIAPVLATLQILVHPSLRPEPFGRVLVEAMAAGVPVVAANEGGVPELIDDGVHGRLARPGSADGYHQHILDLLGNPDEAFAMAQAAKQRVIDHFTLDRVFRDFDQLIHHVLQNRNPRAPD